MEACGVREPLELEVQHQVAWLTLPVHNPAGQAVGHVIEPEHDVGLLAVSVAVDLKSGAAFRDVDDSARVALASKLNRRGDRRPVAREEAGIHRPPGALPQEDRPRAAQLPETGKEDDTFAHRPGSEDDVLPGLGHSLGRTEIEGHIERLLPHKYAATHFTGRRAAAKHHYRGAGNGGRGKGRRIAAHTNTIGSWPVSMNRNVRREAEGA